MKITIEIWEEGDGVIATTARCKKQKDASADVQLYTAMICAGIAVMLPMVAKEFCEKKNAKLAPELKVKKKRNVKGSGVVV